MRTTDEALAQIIYDDHHFEWLPDVAQKMRDAAAAGLGDLTGRDLKIPMECLMADTEEHTIWLLICGKFGEWTQCVNYAWIPRDELLPCAEYIENLCIRTIQENGGPGNG